MTIYWVIVMFVAGKFFFIGVLLALWAATNMVIWPLLKGFWFVIGGSQLRSHRPRAVTVTFCVLIGLFFLIAVLPLPYFSRAEGIVWIPDRAIVRAVTPGFAAALTVREGSEVAIGEPIALLDDPSLRARITVLESQLAAALARRKALLADGYAKAQIADEEVERIRDRLANYQERAAKLVVRSSAAGTLHVPMAADLAGRYFNQGAEIAYVIEDETPTVRVAVTQADVDMIRRQTKQVEVRSVAGIGKILTASVAREVPAATNQLPSAALGLIGGGTIATDPSGGEGVKTLEDIFLFDLALHEEKLLQGTSAKFTHERLGERVYVRFEHEPTPLATRWYRRLRQLLLGRFSV